MILDELTVEPDGAQRTVSLDLHRVNTINLFYTYNIKAGRACKVAFSLGYAICITQDPYDLNSSVTLTSVSEQVLRMSQPGGLILGVKFMIGATVNPNSAQIDRIVTKTIWQPLTRTIWVSCLSHFLLVYWFLNTVFNTLLNPDTLICSQFKSYTVNNFWLRDNLYRDTAPVPVTKFVTGDKFAAPIKLVPRSRQHAIKFVP